MRISKLRIQNFRSFKDQEIRLDDYTCLVGPNGSGKSTILTALNILFRNPVPSVDVFKLAEEDFHKKDISNPVLITATFNELSKEAKNDLKAYVRHGELMISAKAVWDNNSNFAEVKQVGSRNVIKDFAKYFDKYEDASAEDLRLLYNEIRQKYTNLPSLRSKADMHNALREYEEANPNLCEIIESNDQFYGWGRGVNKIEPHFSWAYIPAVKDPTEEQDETKNTTLGKLLQRTTRSKVNFEEEIKTLKENTNTIYKKMLESQRGVFQELQKTIQSTLRNWSHPGAIFRLIWHQDDAKSVTIAEPYARAKIGEGDFIGDLLRSGHGMQRSFIAALLQVLVTGSDEKQPTLLLGFEEPELYQHPPQAKHLATLLEGLSQSDTQVLITTHSPYFISSKGYENIRMVSKDYKHNLTKVSHLTYSQLGEMLGSALNEAPQQPTQVLAAVEQIMRPSQCELFFSKVPILVEGTEDVGFISSYLHLIGRWNEFRQYGCHFIVCEGKTNMSRPLAIANGLGLQPFIIFDGDYDKEDDQRDRDNMCLFNLCNTEFNPKPDENFIKSNIVMLKTNFTDEMKNDVGEELWIKTVQECREKNGFPKAVNKKNPLLIAAIVEELHNKSISLELLEKISASILKHAKRVSSQ